VIASPNYGIDAPGVQRRFLLLGLIGIIAGLFLLTLGPRLFSPAIAITLGMTLLCPGFSFLACAAVMLRASKVGKLRLAARLVDQLALQGNERVLDVGCGHGLMLITAARRLRNGKAIGIDLWQSQDQAGNNPEATLRNARLEGVADRVELKTGDARQLPFEDRSFDAVVSSWAPHNIYEQTGREKAVQEIARVLKPGGRALVLDIRHIRECETIFHGLGFDVNYHGPNFMFVIPSCWLLARKSSSSSSSC